MSARSSVRPRDIFLVTPMPIPAQDPSPIRRLRYAVKARNPLPRGSVAVGSGLLVNGIATYAFLAISRRALGADRYSTFAVLWGLIFILGPGLFQPLEQELSRATADRASRGAGSASVLRKASIVAIGELLIISSLILAVWPWGLDALLGNNVALLIGLLVALATFMVAELVRGILSGRHNFARYGRYMAAEGIGRLLIALFLTFLGVRSVGWFGVAMGGAFLLATAVGIGLSRPFAQAGPDAKWGELTPTLLLLLATSLSESFLLNVGPLAVSVLADEPNAAGRFLNGLIVARVPLFLFVAVKIALLPNLATLAGQGDLSGFRRVLDRLLIAVAVILVIGVAGAAAAGPFVVRMVFDDTLRSLDMGLLAASSLGAMIVLVLALALIALGRTKVAAGGWLVGVATFPLGLLIGSEPFLQVEIALLIATAAAAVVMAVAVERALPARRRDRERDFLSFLTRALGRSGTLTSLSARKNQAPVTRLRPGRE